MSSLCSRVHPCLEHQLACTSLASLQSQLDLTVVLKSFRKRGTPEQLQSSGLRISRKKHLSGAIIKKQRPQSTVDLRQRKIKLTGTCGNASLTFGEQESTLVPGRRILFWRRHVFGRWIPSPESSECVDMSIGCLRRLTADFWWRGVS